jgi:hypothetical protein
MVSRNAEECSTVGVSLAVNNITKRHICPWPSVIGVKSKWRWYVRHRLFPSVTLRERHWRYSFQRLWPVYISRDLSTKSSLLICDKQTGYYSSNMDSRQLMTVKHPNTNAYFRTSGRSDRMPVDTNSVMHDRRLRRTAQTMHIVWEARHQQAP